ncbi:YbaB/EbfC family nucleoid-associated protein [Streptomyces sp. NPDC048718]|uniref:YbaB/EbfC family nucleoid-associated protein n=1 Tax=Streptomyces sp. NPDC048718 TaxID=3365587 RepID=UPI003720BD12
MNARTHDGTADDGRTEPDATAGANPLAESIGDRLAEALADLEAVTAGVAAAEAELRQASYTVRSRDRAVEVTVGSQGQLTGLRFLDGRHRTMTAAELASSVLGAAAEARDAMSRHVMRTMTPFTSARPGLPGMKGLDLDWADIFGSGVLEEPDTSRVRTGRTRLRDEIHEDTEE